MLSYLERVHTSRSHATLTNVCIICFTILVHGQNAPALLMAKSWEYQSTRHWCEHGDKTYVEYGMEIHQDLLLMVSLPQNAPEVTINHVNWEHPVISNPLTNLYVAVKVYFLCTSQRTLPSACMQLFKLYGGFILKQNAIGSSHPHLATYFILRMFL